MDSIYQVADLAKLAELRYKKRPILMQFFTEWCPPCRNAHAVLAEELQNGARFILARVNCDDADELNIEFQIKGVPTVIFVAGTPLASVDRNGI